MEDRLPGSLADVHHHAIVLEPGHPGGLGHELEHPLRLLGWKLRDLAEARDVSLREHEQVRLRLRRDISDRDEAVRGMNVLALADELAEEAILRQR
jgi:hypothetical protein